MKELLLSWRVGALFLVLFVLAVMRCTTPQLTFTGDEPRYAGQGLGLYTTATLRANPAAWNAFLSKSGLSATEHPYASTSNFAPALGPSLVFGPFLRFGGLSVARWVAFLIGCIGIVALYRLLLREVDAQFQRSAAISIAASSLALPLVAYLGLLYPEILLFTAISCALYTLATSRYYATVLIAGALPFIHIRAIGISIALVALVVWEITRSSKSRSHLAGLLTVYGLAIALYFTTQKILFGSILGAAFPAFAPSPGLFLTRIGMQLFDGGRADLRG